MYARSLLSALFIYGIYGERRIDPLTIHFAVAVFEDMVIGSPDQG